MVRPRQKADIARYYKKIESFIYIQEMVDFGQIGRKIGISSADFAELLTTDTQLRQAITTGLIKLRSKFIQRIVDASKDKTSEVNVQATRAAIALCDPEAVLPPAADVNNMSFDLDAYLGEEGDGNE